MTSVSDRCDAVLFGNFEVDFGKWELRRRGHRVKLQRKPFQILRRLLERPGELVSRAELAALLWPDLHVEFEHSLNTAVNVLRHALGDSSRTCRFIETCPGVGYRFVAPVDDAPPDSRPATAYQQRTIHKSATSDCRRGRFFYEKMTNEGFAKAGACYHAAIQTDPNCAAAYAGLAEIDCRLATWGLVPSIPAGTRACSYANEALSIDSDLPEAYAVLATALRLLQRPAAEIENRFRRAVELNPESAAIRCWYSDFLCAAGRTSEALGQLDRADDSEISSLILNFQRAWTLYIRRDFRSAMEQSWKTLLLEPGFAPAQYTLALAHEQLNSLDDAVTELENARASSQNHPATIASLCQVLAHAGEHRQAATLFCELEHLTASQYVSHYLMAIASLAIEGREAALNHLALAAADGDVFSAWQAYDPRLDALRA